MALMFASACGRAEIARLLRAAAADVQQRTQEGLTALEPARRARQREAVLRLERDPVR